MRFGHRMLSFQPSSGTEPVTVAVRGADDKQYDMAVRFLLAADGHRSPTRGVLRIGMTGNGHLKTIHSVLFRAPSLDTYLGANIHQFVISQPTLDAFLTTYNDSRWVLMFPDERERTDQEMRDAILQATGVPDLDYEILATGIWDLRALVADTFSFPQSSRPNIFLLGDAAHTLPPTRGGYGANTGIADAHNLAWKIASVVQKHSAPELLESYDQERRPVAQLRHDQIFAGPDYVEYKKGKDYGPLLDAVAMELGQVYQSHIILTEDRKSLKAAALRPDELKGRAGSRAPHLVLIQDNHKISSLSLLGDKWIILTSDVRWRDAASQVAKKIGLPLSVVIIGDDVNEEQEGEFAEKFGISHDEAVLVRPDGVVAWRSVNTASQKDISVQLQKALSQAAWLCR